MLWLRAMSIELRREVKIELAIVMLFLGLMFFRNSLNFVPSSSDDFENSIERAELLFENGDFSSALWAYLRSANFDNPKVALRIAELYHYNGWNEVAKAHLDKVFSSSTVDRTAKFYLLRGKLSRDDGELERAIALFLKTIEIDSENAEAHYLLGNLLSQEKTEMAVEHYRTAISVDRDLEKLPFYASPIGQLARLQLARIY